MDVDSPLKRCSSAPIIANRIGITTRSNSSGGGSSHSSDGGSSSSAAVAAGLLPVTGTHHHEDHVMASQISSGTSLISDTPSVPNIFSRTRRYSASSFSPLAVASSSSTSSSSSSGAGSPAPANSATSGPRLTPRVSQLRQEECADIVNLREVNHERGLHNQLQISQSWEDLTIVTENWSCRDDLALANPLLNSHHSNNNNCSSPSPTSSRQQQQQHGHHLNFIGGNAAAGQAPGMSSASSIRYPFGMSPSPTRKTFATRRSMSPNHVRPSQLCPVKRKFDMDDNCGGGSPPPHKKMFLDVAARGSSPIHSLPICPSPDSGTYEGRTTPKLFISKLCSSNSLSSFPSSASASPTSQLEMGEDHRMPGSVGGGVGGDGKSATSSSNSSGNNNNNNNLMGNICNNSSSSNSCATTEAKDEGGEGEHIGKEMDEVEDHQMLDLSSGIGGDQGNCDKMIDEEVRAAVKSLKEIKEKVGELEDIKELEEVDDGIGEEEGAERVTVGRQVKEEGEKEGNQLKVN